MTSAGGRSTEPVLQGLAPANPDRIVITVLTDQAQSFLQTKAGQVDYDMGGLPPTAHQELFNTYGVNKSRYFVNPGPNVAYMALNTSRAPFSNVNLRKAVNYAVDRPAWLRVGGLLAGKRTDQILPSGLRGFRDAKIYPIQGANPTRAKQLAGGSNAEVTILHTTSPTAVARAQILQFNLRQMGLQPKLKPQPFAVAIKTAGTRERTSTRSRSRGSPTIRPVRLHQRAAGRREHPGRQQQQLLVLEQPDLQQAHAGRRQALRQRPVRGVREARRRHHAEPGAVGPDAQRQHARVRPRASRTTSITRSTRPPS